MASAVTAPTLFQAAANALTPAPTAAARDAQDIYKVAVENVRQKPKYQKLSQELVDKITTASTIEELAQTAGNAVSLSRFWTNEARWKRAKPGVTTFLRFKDSLDLYAQAGGQIILPVYASICLIAKIAAEVLGAHDDLHTFQEQISYLHRQYTEYVLGQDFEAPLREALTRFYEVTVEFCLEAFSVLSKGTGATISRTITSSLQKPFETLLRNLEKVRNDVDSAMLGEVFKDGKDTKRTLAQPKYFMPINGPVTARSNHNHIGVPDLLSQHFVGRSPQISLIHQHLTTTAIIGPARAAVWGTPGMGKTQLSLRYLRQFRDIYTWTLFIGAGSKDSITSAYRTIASTLNLLDVALAPDDQVVEKVKQWLAGNSDWLLIFDDVKDANDALHFTPTTGQGHILFTTRTELNATTLALPEGCLELEPLSQEETGALALSISSLGCIYSAQDATAARAIADFTKGLPLAVEQLARLSQLKGLSLSLTLEIVGPRAEVLRLEHPASMHERNLSCGALLIETLDEVRRKNEGAAALFILLACLEPSRIPLQIILEAPSRMSKHFARQDTYVRGALRSEIADSNQEKPKQKFRLDDYDPFELLTYKKLLRLDKYDPLELLLLPYKKLFGLGDFKKIYSPLPRIDSVEDKRLQDYWNSYKPLKAVFMDRTTINHNLNILAEAGLIRRLHKSNSLWIHDLYADMTTAIDRENGVHSSNVTAHLASTMVYLSYPIADNRVVAECLLLLPSALRSHNLLLEAGILNDTTIGPELSHLIASTITRRGGMMRETQPNSILEAVEYYKLALHGYIRAFDRLKIHPRVSMLQIVLATVRDRSEEELSHRYSFYKRSCQYQRFGRSAPWRALQTALHIGVLLIDAKQLDQSLKYLNMGFEIANAIFGPKHEEADTALALLITVRKAREEWQAAYDLAMKRAKLFMGWTEQTQKFTGPGLRDTETGARLAADLGNCARHLGRIKEADFWYKVALLGLEASFGVDSPEADFGRMRLARLHVQIRFEAAEREAEEIRELMEEEILIPMVGTESVGVPALSDICMEISE